MITLFIATVISLALAYFLGWLFSEYIAYRKLLKQESKIRQHLLNYPLSPYYEFDISDYLDDLYNLADSEDDFELSDLLDEYCRRDEDYYRTHSDFVIIEKDILNNDDINKSIT